MLRVYGEVSAAERSPMKRRIIAVLACLTLSAALFSGAANAKPRETGLPKRDIVWKGTSVACDGTTPVFTTLFYNAGGATAFVTTQAETPPRVVRAIPSGTTGTVTVNLRSTTPQEFTLLHTVVWDPAVYTDLLTEDVRTSWSAAVVDGPYLCP